MHASIHNTYASMHIRTYVCKKLNCPIHIHTYVYSYTRSYIKVGSMGISVTFAKYTTVLVPLRLDKIIAISSFPVAN